MDAPLYWHNHKAEDTLMGIIAQAVKHMIAGGMSIEAIIEAIAAMEEAQGYGLRDNEKKMRAREQARLRKAKQRENMSRDVTDEKSYNSEDGSRNVTQCHAMSRNVTPSPPDKEKTAQKEITPLDPSNKENPLRGQKKESFLIPEWINLDDWKDFEEMRKKIKKPMTDRARTGIVRKLAEYKTTGQDPGAVLEQSVINGWQDVYPLKEKDHVSTTERPSNWRVGMQSLADARAERKRREQGQA